jgi:hypothetical protein
MQPNPVVANENVLPSSVNTAMREMISVSQKLVSIAEQETQKLIQNDWFGFSALQGEKEKIAERYVKISKEFRDRLPEFRKVDQSLLGQLDALQNTLAQKSKSNNTMIQRMRTKAQSNAHSTLIDAQSLAQKKVVRFPLQDEKTGTTSA